MVDVRTDFSDHVRTEFRAVPQRLGVNYVICEGMLYAYARFDAYYGRYVVCVTDQQHGDWMYRYYRCFATFEEACEVLQRVLDEYEHLSH